MSEHGNAANDPVALEMFAGEALYLLGAARLLGDGRLPPPLEAWIDAVLGDRAYGHLRWPPQQAWVSPDYAGDLCELLADAVAARPGWSPRPARRFPPIRGQWADSPPPSPPPGAETGEGGGTAGEVERLSAELRRVRTALDLTVEGWQPGDHRAAWEAVFATEDHAGQTLRRAAEGEGTLDRKALGRLGADLYACVRCYRAYLKAAWAVLDRIAATAADPGGMAQRLEAVLADLAEHGTDTTETD